MFRAAGSEHRKITLGKACIRLFGHRITRIHEAIAEGIGVNVERRMNEVADIGPVNVIALAEMNRGPEAFRLHAEPDLADLLSCQLAILALGVDFPLERIE